MLVVLNVEKTQPSLPPTAVPPIVPRTDMTGENWSQPYAQPSVLESHDLRSSTVLPLSLTAGAGP
jgi:hypothetical protein